MAISTKPAISRSPVQPRPISLPPDKRNKTGGGTLRTAASLTGPARQTPQINLASQSNRVAQAENATANRGETTRSRLIDRASLEQPSAYSDYAAGGVEVP